ncbi:MAG: sulfurtransferase-like selenium metabolism protein YedF [Desulfarculaceae bacterium]|nr:sulfurtransferase-like selenium metabolism protein YedF [Desulfarculaceae bacterium]
MNKEIDCRKLDCPAPVLNTKKVLEAESIQSVSVLVDNDAAVENVSRFLSYQGYWVSVESEHGFSRVSGERNGENPAQIPKIDSEESPDEKVKTMVLVTSQFFGQGDDELGSGLMVNFLKTIGEMGDDLWRLVFVNSGVKLAVKDSKVISELKEIEKSGVDILVCGTCLTFFELMEEKEAGQTTNMLDIVTSMQLADKVIKI